MYTRAEKERDLIETRREQKAHLERQSRVFPQRTQQMLFYNIERLCLFEYKAKTENKRREIKETEKASILPCLFLLSALFRSS